MSDKGSAQDSLRVGSAFSELLIFEVTETDRELSTVGALPGRCGEAL